MENIQGSQKRTKVNGDTNFNSVVVSVSEPPTHDKVPSLCLAVNRIVIYMCC